MAVSVEDEKVANSGLPALLHELAEGLQSVANYLGAARQVARTDTSERHLYIDILEKALDELGRSKAAFHELRVRLPASASKAGEAAANEGPPMTRTRSIEQR